MKVRYRISLEDYQEAQKMMRKSLFRIARVFNWVVYPILAALILFALYQRITDNPTFGSMWANLRPLVIFLTIGGLYISLWPHLAVRRAYKKNPLIGRALSLELNDAGFEIDDGMGTKSTVTWEYYDRFMEGKRVFVLHGKSRVFRIISKSTLSDDEVAGIRDTLTRCLAPR